MATQKSKDIDKLDKKEDELKFGDVASIVLMIFTLILVVVVCIALLMQNDPAAELVRQIIVTIIIPLVGVLLLYSFAIWLVLKKAR